MELRRIDLLQQDAKLSNRLAVPNDSQSMNPMATKTYTQLQTEIEALKAQAESVRQAELAEVIGKIQDAIHTYGITSQDLFGGKASKVKGAKSKSVAAKFSDGKGNVWVGRGPRPLWLRAALASGRTLAEFETGAAPKGMSAPEERPMATKKFAAKKRAAKTFKAKAVSAKYRDADGHAWSGRGPQPRWFKEALASGKSLADLMAGG